MNEYTLLLNGAVVAEVQEAIIQDSATPPTFAIRADALNQAGQDTYQLRRNSDNRTVPILIMAFHMNGNIRFWTGIVLVQ
jgi:hypothetical protein